MNIRLDNTQLVLFSPGIIIVDKLKVANAINNILSGLFDGDPIILPLPEDAPPEIPRIKMGSKDGRYNLSIAKSRLDFIFKYEEDKRENLFPIPGLFEKFLTIFQYLKENIYTQITRTATVTNWIIELENPAAEFLLSKYIRSETPIIKPYELELHYLTKESIAGFDVNKWTRIKSARKISKPEQNRFISFLIDINTLAEMTYEFNKESLQRLLDESSKIIKGAVEKHFKNMGG
ncbi:MAG: hypothetical protein AB1488_06090 [Nitrospirota bacterium]